MQSFWLALLVRAIKALAGAVVWEAAMEAVTTLLTADLPGDEKRRIVKERLGAAFAQVPSSLLNLAIEAAVTKAKPQ